MSIFRDLGSKGKILLGSRGNYFQGSGEINALFSGIKGAQTPLGASQVIRNYSPQSGGNGGDFDFLVAGPWHDPVLTAHLPGWGFVTNGWWA